MLVTAPHSTFIDPLIIGMTRSTVVAKHTLASAPFLSSLARLVQVVFVNRGKEDSRKATRDAIDAYTTRVKVRFTVSTLLYFSMAKYSAFQINVV